MSLRNLKYKQLFRLAWYGLIAATIFFLFYPVNIGLLRLFLLLSFLLIFCGAAYVYWQKPKMRWVPIIVLISILIPFFLPGKKSDPDRLSGRYVENLKMYEGVRFIWGGENRFGIDCSGLVRKGMINACFSEGIRTFNPRLLRKAFEIWWYDCSARALKDGYRNWTKPLFRSESINSMDHASLKAGDLAVTMDGVHVLAYLGDGEWIEADPGIGKAIRVKVPAPDNIWFDMPVQVLRWNL